MNSTSKGRFFQKKKKNYFDLNSRKIYVFIVPSSIYLFKGNNTNIKTMRDTCSKLTMKTPERRY